MPESVATIRTVPWKIRDALVVFLLPWVLLPIVAIIALEVVAPYSLPIRQFINAYSTNDPSAAFAFVILDLVGSFGVIAYYLRKYHVGINRLGFRRFSVAKLLVYVAAIIISFGILVSAAYYLVQLIDPGFNPDQAQTNEFTQARTSLSLWALVIIPPFVEETVFRGFLFPAFAKRFGLPVGAVIASVLFGLAHLQGNVSIYTFILSLLLCFLYARLGSIIPGIGLHMLNNYVAYTALHQK